MQGNCLKFNINLNTFTQLQKQNTHTYSMVQNYIGVLGFGKLKNMIFTHQQPSDFRVDKLFQLVVRQMHTHHRAQQPESWIRLICISTRGT